jgi:hypothetical protein
MKASSTHLLLVFGGLALGCGGTTAASAPPGDGGTGGNVLVDGSGPDSQIGRDGPTNEDAAQDGGDRSTGQDSGASSDAHTCMPLPNCTSTTTCPATDGCNTCTCEDGVWECTGYACPDSGNLACAVSPYVNDSPCDLNSQGPHTCTWPLPPGYQCHIYACNCAFGGSWVCGEFECGDSGTDVGGDGGGYQTYPCPLSQPQEASSCTYDGAFCGYGTCTHGLNDPYATNCLCSNGAWDCANVQGCQ